MPSVPRLILSATILAILAPSALAAPSGASAAPLGEKLFTRKGCIACHTLKGHDGADGTMGPDLSKIGVDRDKAELIPWILDPQSQKPGNPMPSLGLTQPEAEALADYILTERPRKPKRR